MSDQTRHQNQGSALYTVQGIHLDCQGTELSACSPKKGGMVDGGGAVELAH